MKKIKFAASNLLLVMMCFTFATCSESDSNIDEDSLVNILQKYKWEYEYVDDYNDISYGGYFYTYTYRIYFMDNNVGYYYTVEKEYDSKYGTSTDTYFDKFVYTVSGKNVELQFETGKPEIYTYVGGYLLDSSEEPFKASKMTESDREFVNRKAQEIYEEEENIEIGQYILDNVDIIWEYDEDNLKVNFTLKTELSKKYPHKSFVYGIQYGYGELDNTYTSELSMSGKTSRNFQLSVLLDNHAIFYKAYKELRELIDSGKTLTENEEDYFYELIDYLETPITFEALITVEFDDVIVYLDNDSFYKYIKLRLDTSYEPNNGGGNNGNSQATGTIQGHEYVDLGLSVKWATCNVGASKPEDYGDYYAWGETTTKSDYSWDTYKWCKGTDDTMTKYCTDSDYGTVDNRTTLTSSDDVATVKWGSKWRMPTKEEVKELCDECTWKWTTQSGVNGMKMTGPNGNSIFLPAAGDRNGTALSRRGLGGHYWSATLVENYGDYAYYLGFDSGNSYWHDWCSRRGGLTVRPVTE